MFSSTARVTGWRLAGVVAAIGAFVLTSAGTGSAATSGSPYQVQLDPSTPPPVTAAGFGTTGSCAGIVSPQDDGWHFTVPGGFTAILNLSVSFNTPFSVVFSSDRQQAYVATLPGAQLTQAAATVITLDSQPQVQFLELADTCPAQAATVSPAATSTTTNSPTARPGPFPGFVLPTAFTSLFPSGLLPSSLQSLFSNPAAFASGFAFLCPSASASASSSASASASASSSASASRSASASTSPSASSSASASPSASATATTCPDPGGSFTAAASTSAGASTSSSASRSTGASTSASTSTSPSTSPAPTPSPVASNLAVTG